jgi:hypothetical protein
VGGEAPVTPVSSPDSSFQTFPTNRAITGPRAKEKYEEEHEDSKRGRKARTTSYYTENHKTTNLV